MNQNLVLALGILALNTVSGLNNQNRLVRVWDQITFYSMETGIEQGSWKLTAFPYVDGYEQNLTQSGVMCFAQTLEIFHNECQNQTAADQGFFNWFIMNPFKSESSNEIIDDIKNDRDKNVTGLIFETNQIITTNQTYEWPQIMSEATYDTCSNFK